MRSKPIPKSEWPAAWFTFRKREHGCTKTFPIRNTSAERLKPIPVPVSKKWAACENPSVGIRSMNYLHAFTVLKLRSFRIWKLNCSNLPETITNPSMERKPVKDFTKWITVGQSVSLPRSKQLGMQESHFCLFLFPKGIGKQPHATKPKSFPA